MLDILRVKRSGLAENIGVEMMCAQVRCSTKSPGNEPDSGDWSNPRGAPQCVTMSASRMGTGLGRQRGAAMPSDFQRKCCDAIEDIKREFLDRQRRANAGSGEKKFDPQVIEEIGADLDKIFERHKATPSA